MIMKKLVIYLLISLLSISGIMLTGCDSRNHSNNSEQTAENIVDIESTQPDTDDDTSEADSENSESAGTIGDETDSDGMDIEEEIEIEIGSDEEVDGF